MAVIRSDRGRRAGLAPAARLARGPSVALALIAALSPAGATPDRERSPRPRTISIREAMLMSEARSEEVDASRAGLAGADARVSSARAARYPQIFGSAVYDRTVLSEYDDVFDPPQPDSDTGPAPGGAAELPFGRDNTYRLGLSVTEDLWTGGRTGARVDIAEAGRAVAGISLAQARARAVLTAAETYYDAVLAEKLVAIARETLAQAEETLETTRLRFEQGAASEFDVLRAEVSRDNQRTVVVQQRSARELANRRLKNVLDVPERQPIELTSDLEVARSVGIARTARDVADVSLPPATAARSAVDRAEWQVRQQEANVDLSRAERWPSLRLRGDLGVVNYPEKLNPGLDDWRTNLSFGVSVTLPIFTGGRITADIRASKAELRRWRARLERTEETSEFALAQARERVDVALAVWRSSRRTAEQAARAYEIATLRFEEGVSSQIELLDARVQLEQARVNEASAARDLLVARVTLALLPMLPVAGAEPVAPDAGAAGAPIEDRRGEPERRPGGVERPTGGPLERAPGTQETPLEPTTPPP